MDTAPLYPLYDAFAGDRHTFLYSGQFLDAHTARFITLGEGAVGNAEADKPLRARLAFVLVEAYQNVIRHRPTLAPDIAAGGGRSLFLLRNAAGLNEVSTMNPVLRSEADALVADLEGLGALDTGQLKTRYLETLQQEGRTRRGGAGLGLIEMARRSGNTLRHGLSPIDAEHLLFTLCIDVEAAHGSSSTIRDLQQWHRLVVEAGVVLYCKGLHNAVVQASLMRILEQETADDATIAGNAVLLARNGLDVVQQLGGSPANSTLALVYNAHGPTLIFAVVLPAAAAEKGLALINAPNKSPNATSPAELAIHSLVGSCGGNLRAMSRSLGTAGTQLLLTAPLTRP